jgi:hypothetical protein
MKKVEQKEPVKKGSAELVDAGLRASEALGSSSRPSASRCGSPYG